MHRQLRPPDQLRLPALVISPRRSTDATRIFHTSFISHPKMDWLSFEKGCLFMLSFETVSLWLSLVSPRVQTLHTPGDPRAAIREQRSALERVGSFGAVGPIHGVHGGPIRGVEVRLDRRVHPPRKNGAGTLVGGNHGRLHQADTAL